MILKLKIFMLSIASLFVMAAPLAVGSVASADTYNPTNSVCTGTSGTITATDQSGNPCNNGTTVSSFSKSLRFILNLLSSLVGLVAVLMIIWAGFKYVTSSGKEEGVKSAKNTIIYAIIGLIIVALAQLIVHFVLTQTTNINSGAGPQ